MYAVLRRYTNAAKLVDAIERKSQEVEQILSSVPGFVAYHAIRSGDTLVTVSVCRDRSGTDETTRRAAKWVRENVPTGAPPAPEITEGDVFIALGTPQKLGGFASSTATAGPADSSARPPA
jgi:hypothetical protein